MSMHVEYVITGVPISNQSTGSPALLAWRAAAKLEATQAWAVAKSGSLVRLTGRLKAVIINFHTGDKPSLDLDNMAKPILDEMQGIVYADDRQIRQAEFTHVRIDAPFVFVGASKLIVASVQSGNEFVYVRVEDPVDPFPLPA